MNAAAKKRILFVDDEPMVLKGLQRTLRKMRSQWEMTFTDSSREALDILAGEPFDVIVSDLKMPEMDGEQLLAEVKKRHPNVVRIVLSGQLGQETTLKSVKLAHQSLSKPCDVEILKNVLARLFAVRELLADAAIQKIVSQVESLPSMPAIYTEIMAEIQGSDPSLKKIADIIARDVSMTAKILQVVNSAFFGLFRKISTPREAVVMLGLETIKALVLSVKIFSEFSRKRFSWFNIDALFHHSMAVSMITRAIMQEEDQPQELVNMALMAGLLHDLGKLILATNFEKPYQQVLAQTRNTPQNLWDLEYEEFGTSHAEIGAYLMGLWRVDYPIIEAIAFHHRPAQSTAPAMGLLAAVHTADALEHEDTPDPQAESRWRADLDYLENIGMAERVPAWAHLGKHVMERKAS